MLTTEQIEELNILSDRLMDDVINYLYDDIIKCVMEAGKITGTMEYQIWLLKRFGINNKNIKKALKGRIKGVNNEALDLIEKAAESSYLGDGVKLGVKMIPFADNKQIQQLIFGIKEICEGDILNITGTMGTVGSNGFISLTDTYRQASDYAFKMVSSGALDYDTAVKNATKGLINKGIRTINYDSGISTEVGAAVRRNVISSIGNLTNAISQKNHDELGADGWEISAHFACAPDHEDIQGKQYTNDEFEDLNGSLKRPIGTLHCGHIAYPIFINKSAPVYTEEQLKEMKTENAKGVYYEGQHFTTYEATQKQREIERKIKKQNRKNEAYKTMGAQQELKEGRTRTQQLYALYNKFTKTCNLQPQYNRFKY